MTLKKSWTSLCKKIQKLLTKHPDCRILCLAVVNGVYKCEGDSVLEKNFANDPEIMKKFRATLQLPVHQEVVEEEELNCDAKLSEVLCKNVQDMDVHELRAIVTQAAGPEKTTSTREERKNWYSPENAPAWWTATNIPFMSVNHPKAGQKRLAKQELNKLVESLQHHFEIDIPSPTKLPRLSSAATSSSTTSSSATDSTTTTSSATSSSTDTSSSSTSTSDTSLSTATTSSATSSSTTSSSSARTSSSATISSTVTFSSTARTLSKATASSTAAFSSMATSSSTARMSSATMVSKTAVWKSKLESLLDNQSESEVYQNCDLIMKMIGSGGWMDFWGISDFVKDQLPAVSSTLSREWSVLTLLDSNSNYSKFIPDSVGNRICMQTSANGNCMYNALSIAIYGNETMASFLRLSSMLHMADKVTEYSKYIELEFGENTSLWAATICGHDFPTADLQQGELIELICREEIIATLRNPYRECTLLHLHMVADMLGRPIMNHFLSKNRLALPLGEILHPPLGGICHYTPIHLVWVPTVPSSYKSYKRVVPAVCPLGKFGTDLEECAFEGLTACSFMLSCNPSISPGWIECSLCKQWVHDQCMGLEASNFSANDLFLCGCDKLQEERAIKLKRASWPRIFHPYGSMHSPIMVFYN